MKKRNRSKYIIYFEPWVPGMDETVYSKFQAKKLLSKAEIGSEFYKYRLIWGKDGSCSFWNLDSQYPSWEKI